MSTDDFTDANLSTILNPVKCGLVISIFNQKNIKLFLVWRTKLSSLCLGITQTKPSLFSAFAFFANLLLVNIEIEVICQKTRIFPTFDQ